MISPASLILILGGAFLSAAAQAETYTYPQLVNRMVDMQELAKLPAPGEKTALASSYDRNSRYDAATDKYIAWDANDDGVGFVRKEGNSTVLADIQGPGCIWRTWSATINQGHVKIYLDGAETPAVDLPFAGYFDGKNAPFNRPNLVYTTTARGFNNYTPIPFQKSCKIVADEGWGRYYQFNYTQFPEGTVVPTFKLPLSAKDEAALDDANRVLGHSGQDPAASRPGRKVEAGKGTVPAGKKVKVLELAGPRAIVGLKLKVPNLPSDKEEQRNLLAQLTLSITWDGEAAPAVWSPLGDFFGSSAGAEPFQTLPVGLGQDGKFYSYWYMPFAKSARIEIGNDSAKPVNVELEVIHAPLEKPAAELGRFHAKWHRDAFLPKDPDREIDWTLLTTTGRGRYVGTQLHVWNPRGKWWGEGDEKFFVDGEKFPSTFGTGSEDYFGYAWCDPNRFVEPFHSQPVNEANEGHVSVNRWHISDNIPFQSAFEADIEKYFPEKRGTRYAAVAYWYLAPGGKDPYEAVPVSERVGWWTKPEIYSEPGVIEGESLRALPQPDLICGPQEMFSFGKAWSGDNQLNWRPKQAGDTLELPLPAQKPGKYRLVAHFTKARNYGIFQLSLNGADLGKPLDFYSAEVKATDPVDLGVVTLTGGEPVLKVTATGKNDVSSGYQFGLDYLKLKK